MRYMCENNIANKGKKQTDNISGFTLIELLVVISIIAILMAIMMPALSRAREQARAVQCMSQQRQIFTAISMYVEDYKGQYPYFITDTHPQYGYAEWSTVVRKYLGGKGNESDIRDSKYFTCPSASRQNHEQAGRRTYAMNSWFGAAPGHSFTLFTAHRRQSRLRGNNIVLIGDGKYTDGNKWFYAQIGRIEVNPYFHIPDQPHGNETILTFTTGEIVKFSRDNIVGEYSRNFNTNEITWIPQY